LVSFVTFFQISFQSWRFKKYQIHVNFFPPKPISLKWNWIECSYAKSANEIKAWTNVLPNTAN